MIEKITLKIGEKTIELTEEEARQVWADLNPRYAQPVIYPSYPQYPTSPSIPQYLPWTWVSTCDSIESINSQPFYGKLT